MTRRNLLSLAAKAGVLAAGAYAGAVPALRAVGYAAGRSLRAPSDLLARMRRSTRPLRERGLNDPHDLAG
jgi:hypothetical protein